MPRFKPIHKGHMLLPVDFDRQIQPGSFEHALCYLVDKELDLAPFHARYNNDEVGASAYDPAVLLKIVLLAYSRGIVSEMGELTAKLFAQVLTLCDRQGLIGREMFAIDGVKLPSNASKAKSGTRADFERQAEKMEKAAAKMLAKHRDADAAPSTESDQQREARSLERLQHDAKQMRDWLAKHPEDRQDGHRQGVIQGFTGVAAVDEKHQIVVEAQAHGTGSEQELLIPVVDATQPLRTAETLITADAGYHSEANLKHLAENQVDAYIPDNGYRQRDERYDGQALHKAKPDPLHDKRAQVKKPGGCFRVGDFQIDPVARTCVCPAGKSLYGNGANCTIKGRLAMKFQGAKQDCGACALRAQCLRKPDKTPTRQVAYFFGKVDGPVSHCEQMRHRIDSDSGKRMITRRFATVEPVFGNLRGNKRLDRFTLRDQKKVDGQWKLFCLVHNLEKLAHHGFGI